MTQEPFYRSKFLLGITAIALIVGAWRWAVFHLYSLPTESLAAFQAITSQMLWAVCVIALTIAGVKGVQQMMSAKLESMSSAVTQAVIEKKEQKITEEKIEHIIVEGEAGAPARRPFSPDPTHEEQQ